MKRAIGLVLLTALLACPTHALDRIHRDAGNAAIERGVAYLRGTQNEDGSWSADYGPAITALAITAMLDRPDIDADDPTVSRALDYILSCVNDDGSIHSGILANYNTAISVSALSRVRNRPDVAEAVDHATDFLRGLQWAGQLDPQGNVVDESHPWYGGAGYGRHGRPDISNTQFMLQAYHDAGVNCNDPAVQRALVFLTRCQAVPQNDLYDETVVPRDGGFIYATSVNQDHIGLPESKANPDQIDLAREGRPVSGLRSYGSVTYAGFKSYVYAAMQPDDPRVVAVLDWVSHHYTLEQNPGMPEELKLHGYYYYFLTFSRALDAWGETYVTDREGVSHDWANDLIGRLVELQQPDGSWVNEVDRWLEDDPNLVTGYALIALTHALD